MSFEIDGARFSDRLKRQAEARQAMLAKFKPKPTVTNTDAPTRAEEREQALQEVRARRAEAKAAKKQAALDAIEATRLTGEAAIQAELDAKRAQRKERKALAKAEAKAKRAARKGG